MEPKSVKKTDPFAFCRNKACGAYGRPGLKATPSKKAKLDPLPKKVTGMIQPSDLRLRGHIAYLDTHRKRGHVVIVGARRITRGRWAGRTEVSLASLEPEGFGGKTYGWRTRDKSHLKNAKRAFAKVFVEAAMAKHSDTKGGIEDRKEVRADKGREAISNKGHQIEEGDTIKVKYNNGIQTEKVVKLNFNTGKVAIEVPHNISGVRWLPADICEAIITEAPLPFDLDGHVDKLLEIGIVHVDVPEDGGWSHHQYVVVSRRTRLGATQAQTRYDADNDVYWRDLGVKDDV
jgi:hypothetical protein